MICFKCKKRKGIYNIPSLQKKACPFCFNRIIEKRFSKKIKEMKLKEVNLIVKRPSDKLLAYFLAKKKINITKNGKKINQETLDDKAINVLKSFFLNKDFFNNKKSPFGSISEEELIIYSKINHLDFTGNSYVGDDEKIHNLLIQINKRRPGAMQSIKAFLEEL